MLWVLDGLSMLKPLAASIGTQTVLFCDVSSFTDIIYFLDHSRPSNETKDWNMNSYPACSVLLPM